MVEWRPRLARSQAKDRHSHRRGAVGTLVGFGGELCEPAADNDAVRVGVGSTLHGGVFLRATGRRVWDVKTALASAYSLP